MLISLCSLPDGLGDELIIEVHDSKGKYCGHAVVQVADMADESVNFLDLKFRFFGLMNCSGLSLWRFYMQGEKVRPCFIYCEPEHEQVGKIQLYINYSTTPDENSHKVHMNKGSLSIVFRLVYYFQPLPPCKQWKVLFFCFYQNICRISLQLVIYK